MDVKSLCFAVIIAFSFCFTSVASKKHILNSIACGVNALDGLPCRKCDFLTFGQDEDSSGLISYFCPMERPIGFEEIKEYCCYDLMRRPFCCKKAIFLINGLCWIVAAFLIICGIAKFLKYLLK